MLGNFMPARALQLETKTYQLDHLYTWSIYVETLSRFDLITISKWLFLVQNDNTNNKNTDKSTCT